MGSSGVAKKKVAARPRTAPAPGGGPVRTAKRPPGPDASRSTGRGWLVIAATVAVGAIVFWQGIHRPAAQLQTASTSTLPGFVSTTLDRDAPPPTTRPIETTTVPKPPVTKLPPAEIDVLVANGVDPKQIIAGPVANKLKAQQYRNAATTDLAGGSDTTFVYHEPDLKPEALAVAEILGYPASTVAVMPGRPPVTLDGARILVVIGKDRPSPSG